MNISNEFLRLLIFFSPAFFGFVSSAAGFHEVLIYVIAIKLIYSVIISIVINEWKNKNKLLVESGKDNSMVSYNYFYPTETNTNDLLKNIHFNNKKIMRISYFKFFIPKAIFVLTLLITLIDSIYTSDLSRADLLTPLFGFISVIYITYKLFKCIKLIQAINDESWCIKEQQFDNKTYYSAYIKKSEETYSPFLSEVFK